MTKIDLRIFVIPFSAAASAGTASWLFLCKEGMFNSDPTWDDSLFEEQAIWTYEVIHYIEIFFMTIALITTSSKPSSLQNHFYMAFTITSLHIFFAATSKVPNFSVTGQCFNSTAFALMGSILVTFLMNGMELSCSLAVAAGWMLAIVHTTMAIVYQTSKGTATAGAIITVRTLAANLVTVMFCIILFLGRTEVCEI
jgi:hypothetical protein